MLRALEHRINCLMSGIPGNTSDPVLNVIDDNYVSDEVDRSFLKIPLNVHSQSDKFAYSFSAARLSGDKPWAFPGEFPFNVVYLNGVFSSDPWLILARRDSHPHNFYVKSVKLAAIYRASKNFFDKSAVQWKPVEPRVASETLSQWGDAYRLGEYYESGASNNNTNKLAIAVSNGECVIDLSSNVDYSSNMQTLLRYVFELEKVH